MSPRTYWLIILGLVAVIVGQCAELQCADQHTAAPLVAVGIGRWETAS